MTENLSHSGIKLCLTTEFEKFMSTSFPETPESDDLYDLFSELVELDGHIVGLVSSYLKGKAIDIKLLDADSEFNRILGCIENESDEFKALMKRKTELDKMIILIKQIEELSI